MEFMSIKDMSVETYAYILRIENEGFIDRDCKMCQEVFIPRLINGAHLSDIHAPSHKASRRCESGKHAHCTCDTCF